MTIVVTEMSERIDPTRHRGARGLVGVRQASCFARLFVVPWIAGH